MFQPTRSTTHLKEVDQDIRALEIYISPPLMNMFWIIFGHFEAFVVA